MFWYIEAPGIAIISILLLAWVKERATSPWLVLGGILVAGIVAGISISCMFLSNWLYDIGWWWFGAPARILEILFAVAVPADFLFEHRLIRL